MSSASTGESTPSAAPSRGLWTLLWICWLVGVVLSAVLAWRHHQLSGGSEGGLPGCSGGGFDCDRVLGSPYGKLWGFSVTWFALAYYGVLAAALMAVRRFARTSPTTPAALALPALAAIGLATAGWDVGVMLGVIGSLCPWCLGVHLANTVFFLAAGAFAQSAWNAAQLRREAAGQPRLSVRPAIGAGLLAVMMAGWAMAVLALFHDPLDLKPIARDIPLSKLRIGGEPGAGTPIWTINGPRESVNTVVVFSCFTCPQCKEAHRLLEEIAGQHPGEFRIDYRLVPLSPDCNPSLKGGVAVPPHLFACQLAKVGIALAEAKPDEYPAFAHWLYDQQERMIPPFEAEDEAARRAGRDPFKQAMDRASDAGQRVESRLTRDVKLAQEIGVARVPQIYIGRVGEGEKGTQTAGQLSGHITREQLEEVLGREFGWKTPAVESAGSKTGER